MCYVGRLKGSMYVVNAKAGSQKCSKDLANTKVDLRNAANSLQIEGKGVQPGDPYLWGGGGVGTRNTRPYIQPAGELVEILEVPPSLPDKHSHTLFRQAILRTALLQNSYEAQHSSAGFTINWEIR